MQITVLAYPSSWEASTPLARSFARSWSLWCFTPCLVFAPSAVDDGRVCQETTNYSMRRMPLALSGSVSEGPSKVRDQDHRGNLNFSSMYILLLLVVVLLCSTPSQFKWKSRQFDSFFLFSVSTCVCISQERILAYDDDKGADFNVWSVVLASVSSWLTPIHLYGVDWIWLSWNS